MLRWYIYLLINYRDYIIFFWNFQKFSASFLYKSKHLSNIITINTISPQKWESHATHPAVNDVLYIIHRQYRSLTMTQCSLFLNQGSFVWQTPLIAIVCFIKIYFAHSSRKFCTVLTRGWERTYRAKERPTIHHPSRSITVTHAEPPLMWHAYKMS